MEYKIVYGVIDDVVKEVNGLLNEPGWNLAGSMAAVTVQNGRDLALVVMQPMVCTNPY